MREIKFRAWDVKNNKFIDGYAITCDGTIFSFKEGDCEDYIRGHADIPNTILIQYTGLKDKNGKEIYEGDILKSITEYNDYTGLNSHLYGGNVYEVKNNGWKFYLNPDGMYQVRSCDCKVIGNIYENPELLKGGEKVI